MKKIGSISLIITLVMIGLLLLSSGTARANESVTSPHFAATATPTATPAGQLPNRFPSGGNAQTATPVANQPKTLPQGGGETADGSGSVILIGLGSLLLVSGLALGYRRRKRV